MIDATPWSLVFTPVLTTLVGSIVQVNLHSKDIVDTGTNYTCSIDIFRISSTDPILATFIFHHRVFAAALHFATGMTISVVTQDFSNDASVFRPLEMACDPARDFECCYRCLGHVGIVLLSFETEDYI